MKVFLKETEHHHCVNNIRITIEQAFPKLFWLSDMEMRSGVTRLDKKKFASLPTFEEKDRFYKAWRPKGKSLFERTPDGYFEVIQEGYWYPYVLEYENYPYNRDQIFAVLNGLEKDFPKTKKLIVSATMKNGLRLSDHLLKYATLPDFRDRRKRPVDISRWYWGVYDQVVSLPFEKAFQPIQPSLEKN